MSVDFTQHRRLALTVLVLAWLSLALVGCAPECRPPLETKIDLIERAEFADLDGRASAPSRDWLRDKGFEFDDHSWIQPRGRRVRFGFPVPLGARLRGSISSTSLENPQSRDSVRIVLVDPRGVETVLWNEVPQVGAELDLDLSPWSQKLVNLDLRFGSMGRSSKRTPGFVAWDGLRIEGPAPADSESQSDRKIPRAPYNVLVILFDSLRADHLPAYGGRTIPARHLTRLSEQGVTFTAARSNSSWTRPSVATMFSSQYPWSHGVKTAYSILPDHVPYLPEILNQAGYRVEGATANGMVAVRFGMGRGFKNLHELRAAKIYRTLYKPTPRANYVWIKFLQSLGTGKSPYFGYLHQLDPHSPYQPVDKYRRRYSRLEAGTSIDTSLEAIAHMRRNPSAIGKEQLEHLHGLYRGEVALMDDYVGRLFGLLEENGMMKDTLLVFTSDHGEEFMDHDSMGHGHSVYEELLRVPLIMRLDGVLPAGLRIEESVDLIDFAPTVLDLLGQDVPESMQGTSLLPLIEAPENWEQRITLASSETPLRHSIRYGRWKLIRSDQGISKQFELYNLNTDPREKLDTYRERPIIANALRQMLRWELARTETAKPAIEAKAEVDEATRRELEALGYLIE